MSGGIDWFRWHHGSVADPKFRLVAKRAGATLPEVITVWAVLLEEASAADDRGNFGRIDAEAIDCMLNLPDGRTAEVMKAMADRGLIDGDDSTVTAWSRRQPKREDDTAAERKRRQREREHEIAINGKRTDVTTGKSRNVTQGHADVTPCHDRGEESREDVLTFETTTAHRASAGAGEAEGPKTEDPPPEPPPPDPPPPEVPPEVIASRATAVGEAMREAGIDPDRINLADPALAELLRQGAEPEEFGGIAKEAVKKQVQAPMRWVCVVLQRRRAEAAAIKLAPRDNGPPWFETRSGIEAKAVEVGIGRWDEDAFAHGKGEQWPAYQARVFKAAGHQPRRAA